MKSKILAFVLLSLFSSICLADMKYFQVMNGSPYPVQITLNRQVVLTVPNGNQLTPFWQSQVQAACQNISPTCKFYIVANNTQLASFQVDTSTWRMSNIYSMNMKLKVVDGWVCYDTGMCVG